VVTPVTGPFSRINQLVYVEDNAARFYDYKNWYRQKKPYDLNLTYDRRVGYYRRSSYPMSSSASALCNINCCFPPYQAIQEAKSKAWAKFIDDIADKAEIGNSLAEGHQALSMVSSRLLQVARFAKHLNRFEFEKARRDLSLTRKQTDRWSKDRTAANMFLEVHFGWSPLIGDIHDGLKVLTSPWKDHVAVGRGQNTGLHEVKNNWPPSAMWSYGSKDVYKCKVRYSAHVAVSNPNLALANQLGLINPIATLWELVPYSFVVDWFVNVGQILNSWSDLIGYSITNPTTTTLVSETYQGMYKWDSNRSESGEAFRLSRDLTLSQGSLYIKPFRGFSVTRGVTAAALLMQKMPMRKADLATPSLRKAPIYRWNDYEHSISR
jgi:hypothetical protein